MFNSVGDGGMIGVDEALGFVSLKTTLDFLQFLWTLYKCVEIPQMCRPAAGLCRDSSNL